MGPFGIPWLTFAAILTAGPGMLAAAAVLLRSEWWKNITEYYFSWNGKDTEGGGAHAGER